MKHLRDCRLGYLDQIRAIAICAVIGLHYHGDLFPGGGAGVGLFFALSGFLIGGMLLEIQTLDAAAATRFALRRFLRIYPPYLVAIMATVLLTWHWRPDRMPVVLASLPGLLTFTRTAYDPGMGFGVLWTLQVEMWFYLTMPLAMLLLGKFRGLLMLSALLISTTSFLLFVGKGDDAPALLRWGGALALGSLVAAAWKAGLPERHRRLWTNIAPLACLALFAVLVIRFHPITGAQSVLGNFAAALLGSAAIAAMLANPALPSFAAAAWVGRISYSLYLWHAIVLEFWHSLLPDHFLFRGAPTLAYLAITLGLALLSYQLIEHPAMRAARKLPARIWPSTNQAPATA